MFANIKSGLSRRTDTVQSLRYGMGKIGLTGILVLVVFVLSSCAPTTARGPSKYEQIRLATFRLNNGITETEAARILGFLPDQVELQTCGGNTGEPWTCKVWTYKLVEDRYPYNSTWLNILFYEEYSNWGVNSWFWT